MIYRVLISLLFLVAAASPAFATSIQYELTPLGGDLYRYDYTVFNDGTLGSAIEGIDIYFDGTKYDELSLSFFAPTGWDPMLLHSTPGLIPLYDVVALLPADGIPNGSSLSGFAVEFTLLPGADVPGTQPYDIISSIDFSVLETGQTSAIGAIPEPSTLVLLGIGLAALICRRQRI